LKSRRPSLLDRCPSGETGHIGHKVSRLVDLRIACTESGEYSLRDEHDIGRIRDVRLAAMGTVKMLERQFYLSSAGVRWAHRIHSLLRGVIVGVCDGRRKIGF
jgi:hypothetical protein